ncbi:hypothetical protein B0H19DRAFT_1081039 [Mycena capillaripes]|nr:hypothetical protein B0H19DRAFT_1081039 [Mycena capillaripes]
MNYTDINETQMIKGLKTSKSPCFKLVRSKCWKMHIHSLLVMHVRPCDAVLSAMYAWVKRASMARPYAVYGAAWCRCYDVWWLHANENVAEHGYSSPMLAYIAPAREQILRVRRGMTDRAREMDDHRRWSVAEEGTEVQCQAKQGEDLWACSVSMRVIHEMAMLCSEVPEEESFCAEVLLRCALRTLVLPRYLSRRMNKLEAREKETRDIEDDLCSVTI